MIRADLMTDILTIPDVGTYAARRDGTRAYVSVAGLNTFPELEPGQVILFKRDSAYIIETTMWVVLSSFTRNDLVTLQLRSA
jgi:hypothetical protein